MKNIAEKVIFGIAIFVTCIAVVFMSLDMKTKFKSPEEVQIEVVFEGYINPNKGHQIIEEIMPNARLVQDFNGSSIISVKTKDKARLLDRLRRSIGIQNVRER